MLDKIDENNPTAWFEPLYAAGDAQGNGVPWAEMGVHPHFKAWLERYGLNPNGRRALVVGCGLGDDAIHLEQMGFEVTAFDVAESAVALCRQRFPESQVDFVAADLFDPPEQWRRAFDFVLEIYTVQALPPKYEQQALSSLTQFLAPAGQLLLCTLVQEKPRSFQQGPPWLLTAEHRQSLQALGLSIQQAEEERTEAGNWVYRTLFEFS